MSLLGIDLGTSGCKVVAFSEDGRCLAQAYREYKTRYPQPGWAELDSHEVWQKTCEVIKEVVCHTQNDPVTALSTSAFGEGFVPVTSTRELLRNTILCVDSRGESYAEALARDIGRERFFEINGNLLGPQYSLPKMLWLRDAEPATFERADYFLLWGDLIAYLLGCEAVCNNSHANRTLLFDLKANDWSDLLLNWSSISRQKLGRIVPGGTVIGTVSKKMTAELGLPLGVKVVSGGHDQCCNALGCGCIESGTACCGMGSFECITPVYKMVANPLEMLEGGLNIEHHVLPDLFVSFIYNQGGTLIKWFRNTFAAADKAPEGKDIYAMLNEEMPGEPTRLLTLPHFEVCLSPRYIPDSAGMIMGLRTSTTRGEILKSIMECETLYFVDSIQALRKLGVDTTQFIASGGGAKSNRWLQIKADIFGVPFVRPQISEGGLLGAAMLAGLATGVYKNPKEAAANFVSIEQTFEPDPARHEIYREKLALYREVFPATHELLKRL